MKLLKNSNPIVVSEGQIYEVSTNVMGKIGEPYSAYFGVIFLDNNGIEKSRRIKWLNDFSGEKKSVKIIFKALTKKILLIYRINTETPISSECDFDLEPIDNLIVSGCDSQESFDDVTDYYFSRKNELTPAEENQLERNLVWVFGSPRSGTSWLALQLLSHNTNSIDHPHITEHLGTPHIGILDLTYDRWYDNFRKLDGYFFSDPYKKTWTYYLRKLILNRIYAQADTLDKKIILKEPSVASGADMISESLPNSKMIFLFRDGRDIIDSILDARQKNGFLSSIRDTPVITSQNRMNFIKHRAQFWTYLIENLLKTHEMHSEKSRILIKYEELCKKPEEILRTLYDFLEIQITSQEIHDVVEKFSFETIPKNDKGSGKFARSASPGLWKEHFSEEEKKIMEEIMRPTLNKLGYD